MRRVREAELRRPATEFWSAVRAVRSAAALRPVVVPVGQAAGLICAGAVMAGRAVPGFRAAAVDGYAVSSGDCLAASPGAGVRLPVLGSVPGGGAPVAWRPRSAVKVMTGGRVPPGADAVVPWEDTDLGEEIVTIGVPVRPDSNVRAEDEEVAVGRVLATHGSVLTPPRLSALTAAGIESVVVIPRPRVGILTTGDELVGEGHPLGAGQVVDSNRPLVAAFLRLSGIEVTAVDRVGDHRGLTERTMRDMAQRCDVLVTTGGVSVGEHDWVRSVVEECGEVEFWRVGMRPGKPLLYGRLEGTPLLCLPGSPMSVLVCCYVFLGPLLDALSGSAGPRRETVVPLCEPIVGTPGRVQLLAGWVDDEGFRPLRERHPGLGQVADTDGLAVIEEGGANQGDVIAFLPFVW